MKTSNKILLGGIMAVIIGSIFFVYWVKKEFHKNMIKGSGNIIEKEFPVSDFDKVRVEYLNYELIKSDKEAVTLKIDDNLQDFFNAEVNEEGLLTIKKKKGAYYNQNKITAQIYYKTLHSVRGVSGNGSGEINSDSLYLVFSSGGRNEFKVQAKHTAIHFTSGSKLEIKGSSESIVVNGGSGGRLEAEKFTTKTGTINLGSGAVAFVRVKDHISGQVSSGANLVYYGNPSKSQLESTSGGQIEKED